MLDQQDYLPKFSPKSHAVLNMTILCKNHDILMKSTQILGYKALISYAAKFCSELKQSRSPKLHKMQQSPDLGFKISLQDLQR
jgi:hypothetical protein